MRTPATTNWNKHPKEGRRNSDRANESRSLTCGQGVMLIWPRSWTESGLPVCSSLLTFKAPRTYVRYAFRSGTAQARTDRFNVWFPGFRQNDLLACLGLESPRYLPEHQPEDVQGRCLDDASLRSGDLDHLLEPSQESESLSSQLPPQNTEPEMARQDPGHGSPGADWNTQHPRHAEASATAMEQPLVRMDDERQPKRLFYGDVATGARRQGGQKRCYKNTLKKSLKQ
ncbi:unnamed protein product [Schistocephalus solidus]|uniref:Uncharacterized protein n=1 Tax=Schistocephalus solidus TaxID=70667 RepID=A0A183T1R5_SCHSO|nr:unnamed protein product [Schistocephalus solidus]